MESNSLGKLLPKGINPKRRRKKEPPMAEATSSNDESTPSRRRSRPTTGSFSTGTPDDARSQVSAESDPDSFSLPRSASTIPTQPSPSGPSTAGSPAAQDARLPQSQSSNTTSSETSRRRASTLPAGSSDLAGSSSSLASSDTGLAPPVPSIKRSSSPVGRLKDVFKAKKGAPSNASSSPEPSARPAESDGASEASKSAAGLARPEAEDALTTHPESTASSDRVSRRLSRNERLDTTALPPPRTPPSGDGDTTPLIVNTPPTPTAPDHPTPLPSFPKEAWTSHSTSPFSNVSPLGNMIAQRRGRSGSSGLGPSKLSSITLAPLTPTQEARPSTPGNASSSFFSSMISAVQNTANTLSNSLGQAGGSPKLPAPKERAGREEGDSVEVEPSASATAEPSTDAKEPAVKTLGMGDLSLSHLGIAEATSTAPTPMSARFPDLGETRGRSDSAPPTSVAG
ncbi:hypothetical protein VTK73DRAFT_3984 [Phialemonium thermophilum]|uniref:Uncharacterized protein n=1 Tax=Phialemonium thermophilum TaxID=223376 RepID=A0ABR3VDE2_9PEZI